MTETRKLRNGTRIHFMDRPRDTGTIIDDHKSPEGWATVSWDHNGLVGAGGTSQHRVTSLRLIREQEMTVIAKAMSQ